jgi:hypothetical protein
MVYARTRSSTNDSRAANTRTHYIGAIDERSAALTALADVAVIQDRSAFVTQVRNVPSVSEFLMHAFAQGAALFRVLMARVQSSLEYSPDLLADIVSRYQAEPLPVETRWQSFVRKTARLMGGVWIGLVVLGVLDFFAFEVMPSFDRGTILSAHGDLCHLYMLAMLAMPGYALARWGSARVDANWSAQKNKLTRAGK